MLQVRCGPRFSLGRIYITPNAHECLSTNEITESLNRHARGDWGEIDITCRQENEIAVREGRKVISVFRSTSGTRFWIITEADRSTTTVLLPEDY